MKLEIDNGTVFGTIEWHAPGDVRVQFTSPGEEQWFRRYFQQEDAFLSGPVECAQMELERRDSSERAFLRAAYNLAGYAYRVRSHKGPRHADAQRPPR